MKDKEKVAILRKAYEDVIWMAVRYAHGRHTYAPDMVRESVNAVKRILPDFKLREDITIEPPTEKDLGGLSLRSDYLDDLF